MPAQLFSHVRLFVTSWTVAHQAPLSMEFSRLEYWNEFPCPPPEDLPDPGIEPTSLTSPALAGKFFITSATWKASKRASLVAQTVQNLPAMQETQVRSLSWEDPLEKEIATHSSILAWRTLWTEEPGIVELDMTVKLTQASKSSVSR